MELEFPAFAFIMTLATVINGTGIVRRRSAMSADCVGTRSALFLQYLNAYISKSRNPLDPPSALLLLRREAEQGCLVIEAAGESHSEKRIFAGPVEWGPDPNCELRTRNLYVLSLRRHKPIMPGNVLL